jgi:hypothetical protein
MRDLILAGAIFTSPTTHQSHGLFLSAEGTPNKNAGAFWFSLRMEDGWILGNNHAE